MNKCLICHADSTEIICHECIDVVRYMVERSRPSYNQFKEDSQIRSKRSQFEYIEEICDVFNVTKDMLLNSTYCGRDMVDARHIWSYVLWYVYGLEHKDIAKIVHRNPSNIAHSKRRVHELLQNNSNYRQKTRRIFDMIREDTK